MFRTLENDAFTGKGLPSTLGMFVKAISKIYVNFKILKFLASKNHWKRNVGN